MRTPGPIEKQSVATQPARELAMMRGQDHHGRKYVAVFASTVTLLLSGACGRTPLLDPWRALPVDAQGGPDVDASDSRRDSGPDVGVAIGNNAIAEASCSPNDATAVSIHIGVDQPSCASTSSGSSIVINIWYTSWDYLEPGTYLLDANGGHGMSVYFPAQGVSNWEAGTNTVLTIKSIDSARMSGHLGASFPSGTVSVDFAAQWCGGNPMCG